MVTELSFLGELYPFKWQKLIQNLHPQNSAKRIHTF